MASKKPKKVKIDSPPPDSEHKVGDTITIKIEGAAPAGHKTGVGVQIFYRIGNVPFVDVPTDEDQSTSTAATFKRDVDYKLKNVGTHLIRVIAWNDKNPGGAAPNEKPKRGDDHTRAKSVKIKVKPQ